MEIIAKLLLSGGILAGAAVLSKPSEESFKVYFRNRAKNDLTEDTDLPVFMNKIIASTLKATSRTYFKDYGVCRVAFVKLPGSSDEIYFVGAFRNWVEVPSIEFLDELEEKEGK